MQDRVGEEFDGTISGVASFGLFVTLDGLNIDGLVHVTELGRDYFHFQQARHALIGEKSGRRSSWPAACACASCASTSKRAKIDFTLAEVAAPAVPRPRFSEPLSRESPPPPRGKKAALALHADA